EARAVPVPGLIWSTLSCLEGQFWHYALSIDLHQPWQLRPEDFYPEIDMARRWVARRWHRDHHANLCVNGSEAESSGCLFGEIRSADDFPSILNDRSLMVENDTHQFDLWQFAPVEDNGWVFLGETGKYVSVSSKRFSRVRPLQHGLLVTLAGVVGEEVRLTALMPNSAGWTVLEKLVKLEHIVAVVALSSEPSESFEDVLQV
ncbi:unnamed protein product, partial [Symbiodinium necroappetens]